MSPSCWFPSILVSIPSPAVGIVLQSTDQVTATGIGSSFASSHFPWFPCDSFGCSRRHYRRSGHRGAAIDSAFQSLVSSRRIDSLFDWTIRQQPELSTSTAVYSSRIWECLIQVDRFPFWSRVVETERRSVHLGEENLEEMIVFPVSFSLLFCLVVFFSSETVNAIGTRHCQTLISDLKQELCWEWDGLRLPCSYLLSRDIISGGSTSSILLSQCEASSSFFCDVLCIYLFIYWLKILRIDWGGSKSQASRASVWMWLLFADWLRAVAGISWTRPMQWIFPDGAAINLSGKMAPVASSHTLTRINWIGCYQSVEISQSFF